MFSEVWAVKGISDNCSKTFELFEDWTTIIGSISKTFPNTRVDAVQHVEGNQEYWMIHAVGPGKLLPSNIVATYRADKRVVNEVAIKF